MLVRTNQSKLSAQEWQAFIDAVNATHGVQAPEPQYRAFVQLHVRAMDMADAEGMTWRVHTMGRRMRGRNFLSWHRQFLLQFEARLRQVDPRHNVPYWDPIATPQLPGPISTVALLSSWTVTRDFHPDQLPTQSDVDAVNSFTTFRSFQSALEMTVHAFVHEAVGGTMSGSSSPADPLFWLHHANIDRLWSEWQTKHPKARPSNMNEILQPPPLFGVRVRGVLDITTLGYKYQ